MAAVDFYRRSFLSRVLCPWALLIWWLPVRYMAFLLFRGPARYGLKVW